MVQLEYSVGMFVRISKSGERRYLQLVESYRNEAGQPRHRVVANLGRIDGMQDGHLDPLIRGLCRVAGRDEPEAPEISHAPAKAFGDVFALHELWRDLGFDRALGRALRSGKRKLDVEALVRAMVFNRLCDPSSKLGCLRWLDTVAMPEMPAKVEHHHLLRAMDALMDNVDRVEAELARQIRPLVDRDLTVVFYDLTTVRIHGEGEVEDDIRAFGMNKETGGIARQFVLGVVQTAELNWSGDAPTGAVAPPWDLVLGADLTYNREAWPALVAQLKALRAPALLSASERRPNELDNLRKYLTDNGLRYDERGSGMARGYAKEKVRLFWIDKIRRESGIEPVAVEEPLSSRVGGQRRPRRWSTTLRSSASETVYEVPGQHLDG